MTSIYLTLAYAVTPDATHTPNLWGALGCAVAFAGAAFALVEAIADYAEVKMAETSGLKLYHRLRYNAKLGAGGISVVAAGSVLGIDQNWFALITLSLVFVLIVGWSLLATRRGLRRAIPEARATAAQAAAAVAAAHTPATTTPAETPRQQ